MGQAHVSIAHRYCGPPTSGNGGYSAGLLAGFAPGTTQVRLLRPPPLGEPLSVEFLDDGVITLQGRDGAVAEARPFEFELAVPPPVSFADATAAAENYAGFRAHQYPTCFVCGPARQPGDGLCVFAGKLPGREVVAAPWRPDASLAGTGQHVRPEFIWAALDCPGYFAVTDGQLPMLLGTLAVEIHRPVSVHQRCVVLGWHLSSEGRKHRTGTVLYDENGEPCARSLATWIELKTQAPPASPTTT